MNKKVLVTAMVVLGLLPSLLFAQLYRIEVDAQDSGGQKVIDRVFTGNTVGLQVSFFDGGSPLSMTNWNTRFLYGYGQYDTNGMVSIAGATGATNNVVVFESATNVFFSENGSYYFSIVGTNAAGKVRTFARGRLIEEYDPATGGSYSNGIPMPWGNLNFASKEWIVEYIATNEFETVVSYGTNSTSAARGDWFAAVSADVVAVNANVLTGKVDASIFAMEELARIGADAAISNTLSIYATGKLDAATAATTYQPAGDYATGTPVYVEADAIALAAIPTNAVCVGGWLNPDAFTVAPVAFTASTNVTAEAFETNLEYVARLLTLDGAPAFGMNPSILRQSDTNWTPIAWSVTSAGSAATFSNDAVYFNGESTATVSGTIGAWTVTTNMAAAISPPVVQTQAYSAVAGTARALIDAVIRPGIEAGKTNVVMVGMTGNTNLTPVLAGLAWNTNSWLGTNQPTCVSWSNSAYPVSGRCVAITSNAVLAARHWWPQVGNELLFMDSTGGHHRTTAIGGYFPSPTNVDMKILFVDPPLPPSIRPAKFLPDNYASYIADEYQLPAIFFDKFYRGSVGFLHAGGLESNPVYADDPPFSPWSSYYQTPISGDSGNAVLLPFGDDNFAILTVWFQSGNGPNYVQFRNNVVTGLVATGSAYTNISIVDFGALGLSPLGE